MLFLILYLKRLETSFLGLVLRFKDRGCRPLFGLRGRLLIIEMQAWLLFFRGDGKPFRFLVSKLNSETEKKIRIRVHKMYVLNTLGWRSNFR